MIINTFEQHPPKSFPFEIENLSVAKNPSKPELNEDLWGINETSIVLSDGATNKSGGTQFGTLIGGQIASRLVVESCLSTDLNWESLVKYVNFRFQNFYEENQIDSTDPLCRVAASLLSVRIYKRELLITMVNNTGFRINGDKVYLQETACDILHSKARSDYINLTNDIPGSRDYIMPLLQRQLLEYQNNKKHPLGYGVVDGTFTPRKFIRTYGIPLDCVKTLELFTDGYPLIPKGINIEDWENTFREVQENDPYRYTMHPATKIIDDRTVIVMRRKC